MLRYLYSISIKVKQIKSSYNVEQVFNIDIPALQHGCDGLIYTCVNTPYSPGTDTNMYALISHVVQSWRVLDRRLVRP